MPTEREGYLAALDDDPTDDIERKARRIAGMVAGTRNDILEVIGDINLDNLTRSEQQRVTRRVNEILGDMDKRIPEEVSVAIDDIYERGRAYTLLSLGAFATIGAARSYLRSDRSTESRTHRSWKMSQKETTMEDLLAMTSNTRRRVKSEVRRVAAESFREGFSTDTTRRAAQQRLENAGMHGITDAAGRRWKMSHYADVVMKTKMVEAHREAGEIEALERGAGYVVISQHGDACPKCTPWEGQILRINDDIDGHYPTVDEAVSAGLYHPGCLHSQVVIRDPNIVR